jgi:Flp pilus assembly protein TadD
MIVSLLIVASVSTAPPIVSANPGELLVGASHAIRANRLDQATVMISRAVSAGASGQAVERALADLAYARGSYAEALAEYWKILKWAPRDQAVLEPAAISALKLGEFDKASSLLSAATSGGGASWRVWNACGVLADLTGDWARADRCYGKATRMAPSEPAPVNNRGWSLLLRGRWQEAASLLQIAKDMDPDAGRIADNLDLATAALDANLPERAPGESTSSWSARLNDAGMAAAIRGNRQRAAAAFERALEVSGTWYVRAANNLQALGQP